MRTSRKSVFDVVLSQLGAASNITQRLREAVGQILEHARTFRESAGRKAADYSEINRLPIPAADFRMIAILCQTRRFKTPFHASQMARFS